MGIKTLLLKMRIRCAAHSSGQAMVEFAICLPVLITIFCGIMDFGWVYMNEYEVNHATYEAARYAEQHTDDSGMTSDVLEANIEALVRANLTHCSDDLEIECTGLFTDSYPSITVTNPVHMLTYVGYMFFGEEYDMAVTNTYASPL